MEPIRIKLAAVWIALMLVYLLGDVLRIFSGDFEVGEVGGMEVSPGLYLGMAVLMLLPILMVLVNIFFEGQVVRWSDIILAVVFFLVNAVGLPTYPGLYDKFLIAVSLGMNILIVWLAWGWVI
jgi:hypothetical protein